MKKYITLLFFFCGFSLTAQYWQQAVDYVIDVELDHVLARYRGTEKLVYTNNSPESLHKVFFHQYFNAFQNDSEMAVRQNNGYDKNPIIHSLSHFNNNVK